MAYKNLEGQLEFERAKSGQLEGQVSEGQMTIAELQKRIAEAESDAEGSGFGKGLQVDYDPTKGTITVTLPNTLLFTAGKATLKKSTISELDHIRSVLQSQYASKEIGCVRSPGPPPVRVYARSNIFNESIRRKRKANKTGKRYWPNYSGF